MMCDQQQPEDVIDGEAQVLLRHHYAGEIAAIRHRHARRRSLRRGVAALAALLMVTGFAVLSTATRAVTMAATQPGIHDLPDGTRIHLDAGASIEIPWAPWRRDVSLTRGDAVFEVTHHPGRPFTVRAGTTQIRDLGTRFMVHSTPAQVAVAVFEGAAELSDDQGHVMTLAAGHAARVAAGRLMAIPLPDETEATAWRQGRMIFRDTPLVQVAERLSQYGGMRVILAEPVLADLRVNGVFNIADIAGALTTLQRALPVRVVSDGAGGWVVSKTRAGPAK